MGAHSTTPFNPFELNMFSRRRLLMEVGAAAVLRPATGFAQGQCGGARAGTPACDRTPAKLPFEPTGWKTVLLDKLTWTTRRRPSSTPRS
jgi:hypothetical protein